MGSLFCYIENFEEELKMIVILKPNADKKEIEILT